MGSVRNALHRAYRVDYGYLADVEHEVFSLATIRLAYGTVHPCLWRYIVGNSDDDVLGLRAGDTPNIICRTKGHPLRDGCPFL